MPDIHGGAQDREDRVWTLWVSTSMIPPSSRVCGSSRVSGTKMPAPVAEAVAGRMQMAWGERNSSWATVSWGVEDRSDGGRPVAGMIADRGCSVLCVAKSGYWRAT
jgi:hypothetical protein